MISGNAQAISGGDVHVFPPGDNGRDHPHINDQAWSGSWGAISPQQTLSGFCEYPLSGYPGDLPN